MMHIIGKSGLTLLSEDVTEVYLLNKPLDLSVFDDAIISVARQAMGKAVTVCRVEGGKSTVEAEYFLP